MSRADEFYDMLVEAVPGECLLWPHARSVQGYGQVQWHGRVQSTHVLACEYQHGPHQSDGYYEAAHSCRNRHCFNPHHLRWATAAENQFDRDRDGTMHYQPVCRRGHEITFEHGKRRCWTCKRLRRRGLLFETITEEVQA